MLNVSQFKTADYSNTKQRSPLKASNNTIPNFKAKLNMNSDLIELAGLIPYDLYAQGRKFHNALEDPKLQAALKQAHELCPDFNLELHRETHPVQLRVSLSHKGLKEPIIPSFSPELGPITEEQGSGTQAAAKIAKFIELRIEGFKRRLTPKQN